jgi:hypothetical protein
MIEIVPHYLDVNQIIIDGELKYKNVSRLKIPKENGAKNFTNK